MNSSLVGRLVRNDLYFHRWTLLAYALGGALALGLIAVPEQAYFYIGSTLLITVLVAAGIHLVVVTVVEERQRGTLAFVMSLPVSARQYTLAKVTANLSIFLVLWTALLAGVAAVILSRDAMPDGLIPFAAVLLGELLAGYCLVLAVALVSESMGWTVAALVLQNLGFQLFLYWLANASSLAATLAGPEPVWSPAVFALLAIELAGVAGFLGLTFFLQGRKTDFL